MPTATTDQPISLPDPDAIRAAIDAADERARLLRRLLRLALRFRLHPNSGGRPAEDEKQTKGGRP